jgi:hypothetical protein
MDGKKCHITGRTELEGWNGDDLNESKISFDLMSEEFP